MLFMANGIVIQQCEHGTCTGASGSGRVHHACSKAHAQMSVKEDRRGQSLKILLTEVPFASAPQLWVASDGSAGRRVRAWGFVVGRTWKRFPAFGFRHLPDSPHGFAAAGFRSLLNSQA